MSPTRLKLLVHSLAPVGELDITDMDAVAVKRAAAFVQWQAAEAAAKDGQMKNVSMPGLSGGIESRPAGEIAAEWEAVIAYLDSLLAAGDGTVGTEAGPAPTGRGVSFHARPLVW